MSRRSSSRWFSSVGWWLDVVYPLALGILMVYLLTAVLYADRKHRRIASFWENQLLKFSLQLAGEPPPASDPGVLAINFADQDVAQFGKVPPSGLIDARIDVYAQVIAKLSAARLQKVILSWTPGAHDGVTQQYAPLVAATAAFGANKIFLGYPQGKAWTLPHSLLANVESLSDLSCQEPIELICPYLPQMQDWMVQRLFDTARQKPVAALGNSLSDNLTLPQAGYILYLPSRRMIPSISFTQFLRSDFDVNTLNNKMVFVGNSIIQPSMIGDQVDLVRRIWTIHDQAGQSIRTSGTPMHLFWASLAEQLRTNDMIPVATKVVTTCLALIVCFLLWIIMVMHGAAWALAAYLCFVLAGPWLNGLGIRYGWFYAPLFDAYYAGLIALIVAGFGKLSYTTFRRWRSLAESRLQSRTRDLKENFVSMFSHNLNTPIAKVLGTLEIMNQQVDTPRALDEVLECMQTTTQMQLLVRCALISAAAREQSLNQEALTLGSLRQELASTLPSAARRLGYQLTLQAPDDADSEFLPLVCDRRAMTTLILATLASRITQMKVPTKVTLTMTLQENGSAVGQSLDFELHGSDQVPDSANDFLVSVLQQTTSDIVRFYGGSMAAARTGVSINLACPKSKPTSSNT